MSGTMVVERTIAGGTVLVWPVDTFGLNAGVGADGPLQHHDTANKAVRITNGQHLAWAKPAGRSKSFISSIIGPHASIEQSARLTARLLVDTLAADSWGHAAIPLNFNVHPFAVPVGDAADFATTTPARMLPSAACPLNSHISPTG
jgi:hypothetical protein